MKLKHNAGINSDFVEEIHWGSCTCGWTGDKRTSDAEAFKDVADHLSPIPRPQAEEDINDVDPDGLDVLQRRAGLRR